MNADGMERIGPSYTIPKSERQKIKCIRNDFFDLSNKETQGPKNLLDWIGLEMIKKIMKFEKLMSQALALMI